ncbi:MAG: hypothetical protein ACP5QO_04410 [Clostridia bacterium]
MDERDIMGAFDDGELRNWLQADGLPRDRTLQFDKAQWESQWRDAALVIARRARPSPHWWKPVAAGAVALLVAAGVVGPLSRPRPEPAGGGLHPRLYLAVLSPSGEGIDARPMWHGWQADRRGLAALQRAWEDMRYVRPLASVNGGPSFFPTLQFGFQGGVMATLMPLFNAVDNGSGLVRSRRYLVLDRPGLGPELVRSPFLMKALSGAWSGLKPGTPLSASVASHAVTLKGSGGAIGNSVTLYASPIYGDNIGGGIMQPGSFPVATVSSRNGVYYWHGVIRLPRGYTVYHPIQGWQLSVDVHGFPGFSELGGASMTLGLPDGAVPPVSPSPVTTLHAAFMALDEALPENPFPYWPGRAGQWAVSWVTASGVHVRGRETISGWYGDAEVGSQSHVWLLVTARLSYRVGSRHPFTFTETWTVNRDGTFRTTTQSGRAPQPAFHVLRVRSLPPAAKSSG